VEELIKLALAHGFTYAAALNPAALSVRGEVRDMCAAGRCRAYGHNWTCPPHCGTLEACGERIAGMSGGLLVQTVGQLEDSFDIEAMAETERLHLDHFHALADLLRERWPGVLCLGSGGCRLCKSCAYPEPCRFPERACSSMEGYGLLVNDACEAAGVSYYYGKGTLAYTACYLFPQA
jgi:predicted metal-binding protein